MKAWKAFEKAAAALFNGKRFWANSGERLDFEGFIYGFPILGQCKLVKTLSLEALTKLAEEKGVDVVVVKRRRGKGKPSQTLVVFTEENYRKFHCDTISPTPTVAPCVPSSPSPTLKRNESTSPSVIGRDRFWGRALREFLPENQSFSPEP
jgi:hypothetical protein